MRVAGREAREGEAREGGGGRRREERGREISDGSREMVTKRSQ